MRQSERTKVELHYKVNVAWIDLEWKLFAKPDFSGTRNRRAWQNSSLRFVCNVYRGKNRGLWCHKTDGRKILVSRKMNNKIKHYEKETTVAYKTNEENFTELLGQARTMSTADIKFALKQRQAFHPWAVRAYETALAERAEELREGQLPPGRESRPRGL